VTDDNRAQEEHWNGPVGQRWVAHQAVLDASLHAFGEAGIERLALKPGESVLDVGCGAGATSHALAARVGRQGRVVGVDLSGPLVARARALANSTVEFVQADATLFTDDRQFDAIFSRFGVMFFSDPVSAFRNLRRALTTNGRIGWVCWRAVEDNPWCSVPIAAAVRELPVPPPPPDPSAPGPFSLAAESRIREILAAAGFDKIRIERFDAAYRVGNGGLDETVAFLMQVGPTARLALDQSEAIKARIEASVRGALEAQFGNSGDVAFNGSTWLVHAEAA
jgi:SAM-dependent methyltransferase